MLEGYNGPPSFADVRHPKVFEHTPLLHSPKDGEVEDGAACTCEVPLCQVGSPFGSFAHTQPDNLHQLRTSIGVLEPHVCKVRNGVARLQGHKKRHGEGV